MPHKTSLFTKWERQRLFRPRRSTYGAQTVLSTLTRILLSYLCTNTMRSASPHFRDAATEASGDPIPCPGPCSQQAAELVPATSPSVSSDGLIPCDLLLLPHFTEERPRQGE